MKQGQKMLTIIMVVGVLAVLAISTADIYLAKNTVTAPPNIEIEEVSAPSTEQGNTPQSTAESVPQEEGVFRIASSQSEVRFSLGELLGGVPTRVIGKTNQVRGEISIDFENPSQTELGEISVNADDLETDNKFRNRAIQGTILNSSTHKIISFVPTEIITLPETISFGESLAFDINGNLTIKGVTQSVTFSATITPISETQIEGHAETMIAYADYDIFIPSVPRVADVDEEVLLEIDFVALLDS
ncbi:MAG: YceI family protein [Anaerolineae bacterium]|jgi:polyisoprenoid-binding protein YceI|nr:YceI family protein [Anaerolineae bacterium]MBT7075885.1 YceI family protein [Anaerolineae bacterium]